MLDNTRRMNPDITAELTGGYHDPVGFDYMMDNPDEWWIRRKREPKQIQPFGRRPRPEPRTMPLLVALPILAWMLWTGEIKWR